MKSLVLFAYGLFHTTIVMSQVEIKGIVLDEYQEPIENASVFLNNTSYSTATSEDGSYSFEIPEGNYELVVYHYGYSAVLHPLSVDQPLDVKVKLKPLSLDLAGHEVSAYRDPEWYKNLEVFKRGFLGLSRNGKACELINPTAMILDGDKESNSLAGWANSPLIIRNKRLGYDITYVLEAYERSENMSSYAGYVTYRDIPGLALKKRHISARERAYKGSTMHFVRSLIAGTAEEEGFELQKFTKKDWEWELEPASFSDILSYDESGVYLQGSGRYQLTYHKEKPEIAHVQKINLTGRETTGYGQVSEFEFLQEKVELTASGAIEPPLGILFSGYMGWEKVGDAVPLDYQPNP